MAITITCMDDANHTISSSKKILSRQGELGETITFSLPSTLNVAYPRAWIMVQQPDGQLYYIDNGSGAGFTWPNPYKFTYDIGDRDTMLSSDGTLGIQIVLRDATPPAQTVEWRSRILYLTIEGSILSNVDSGGSLVDSLSSGTLNRLADIQYDSLADGDLLYRDTATGKWRNVTLVDGANISHVLNKTTGELTLRATGNISTLASDLVYTDAGGYYAGSDGETIGQEIGASLALIGNYKAQDAHGAGFTLAQTDSGKLIVMTATATVTLPAINTIRSGSLFIISCSVGTTTIALNGNSTDAQSLVLTVGNSIILQSDGGSYYRSVLDARGNLNASGAAPIYACRAWVNFNGTGTVAIRSSGNVSSITDNGTGDYTVNFTTALPNSNYSAVITGTFGGTPAVAGINLDYYTKTTTALRILIVHFGNSPQDCSNVNVAIFA